MGKTEMEMASSVATLPAFGVEKERPKPIGLWQIPLVFIAPRRLFARMEDVSAYAWPLVVLLTAATLLGYFNVQTGLVDRQVDNQTEKTIADLENLNVDVIARSELSKQIEEVRKTGEFMKMLSRMQVIVFTPMWMLLSCLLVSAALYGAVAMSGRKPEWNTLLTLCVFSSYVELARMIFGFVLTLRYHSLEVTTSLSKLADRIPLNVTGPTARQALAAIEGALNGFDPFVMWFWLLVVIGTTTTRQLGKLGAVIITVLMWLVSTGIGIGLQVAQESQMQG